jgi:hypothetical protein
VVADLAARLVLPHRRLAVVVEVAARIQCVIFPLHYLVRQKLLLLALEALAARL